MQQAGQGPGQGRARAGQGRAGRARAGQGRTGQGRTGQSRAEQGRAGQSRAGQARAGPRTKTPKRKKALSNQPTCRPWRGRACCCGGCGIGTDPAGGGAGQGGEAQACWVALRHRGRGPPTHVGGLCLEFRVSGFRVSGLGGE